MVCGALAGGCGAYFWAHLASTATHVRTAILGEEGGSELATVAFPQILREVRADLDDGEYAFFPNRRSVWVVNTTNGRMALYLFHDDEVGSVDRSRVAQIDVTTFPPKDTIVQLSDRNYVNVLWVCNKRTGDVQMWHPGRDGVLHAENPISTSIDLMDRAPGSGAGRGGGLGAGRGGDRKTP